MRLTTSLLQEILIVNQSTSLYSWAHPCHSWHLQAQSHPPLRPKIISVAPSERVLHLALAHRTHPKQPRSAVEVTHQSDRTKTQHQLRHRRTAHAVRSGRWLWSRTAKNASNRTIPNCTSEQRQEAQNKCSHACTREIHHCNTTKMSNNRHITRPDRNIISVARSQQCFSLLLTPPRGADTSKTKSSVNLAQRERKSAVCHQRAAPKR